ncbi:hypothetical protein [Altibacter sp. HG106]|uniref:hypothetical protein n=1 Tax=Altibacter sp. HG106 TaxID=3023937 RepID=UPI00234FD35B|nr:hypothetical protein [Altibacter sp. HG106]MDC7995148.1 hypothetical protein [Altibacter sp. HG106]
MKRLLVLVCLMGSFIACKNQAEESETVTTENVETFRGEFIYVDNAAVLNGSDFIYGVELNEMAMQLADRVENIKSEPYDMVPVIVTGVLKENPARQETGEGWEQLVSITEILHVSEKPSAADIKIKDTKN